MTFNSLPFVVFFLLFFFFYWFIFNRSVKLQNLLVLAGSYVFYAWWDWKFLLLLAGSTLFSYAIGYYIDKKENPKHKLWLLYLGLIHGIGVLLYFKYFNFFITSFASALSTFNIHANLHTLNIILPLGISFYTFRNLSYIIDIYKGKIKPESNGIIYFSYVAFFPSLISGPIDRANLLVPQLKKKREFMYLDAVDGMRQILWGLFKKMVVADNCGGIVDQVFSRYATLPGPTLLMGAFFYTIELYADFSGYSDIAIGVGKLLGFRLTKNFNFPYFSENIADYWRRWHMSLTSWVTDYVFTPLSIAFRDYGNLGLIGAIMINLVIVGIWHGANWTFVLYGVLHGLYFIPLILSGKMNKKKKKGDTSVSFGAALNILGTFLLVMLTDVIFRADSVTDAFKYYYHLFSPHSLLKFRIVDLQAVVFSLAFSLIMLIAEWFQRHKDHGLEIGSIKQPILRWSIYTLILFFIGMYMVGSQTNFLYFKF